MSSHTGVSCDACLKTNFPQRRYKCLLCENYDLCGSCHDLQAESEHHRFDHPMQCILTKSAYDLFYAGETIAHRSIVSLTCPYCAQAGFLPRTLFTHCVDKHPITPSNHHSHSLVMCPICVVLPSQTCQTRFVSLADHLAREHEAGPRPIIENKRELVDHEDDEDEDEEGVPLYILAERLFLKEETQRQDYSALVQSQRALHRRTHSRHGALHHLHHASYSIIARSAMENTLDSNIYSESFADALVSQTSPFGTHLSTYLGREAQYLPSVTPGVKPNHQYQDQNETNDRMIQKKYRCSRLWRMECQEFLIRSNLPTCKQKRSCHHPTQTSFATVLVSQPCQEQMPSFPLAEKDPRSLLGKLLKSIESPTSCSAEEERDRPSFVASLLLSLISPSALPT